MPFIVGAVLCGGASRRFGSDKALAPAGQLLLGQRVVVAMRDAGIDPVVAVGGQAGLSLGTPTIADRTPGRGPLAALAGVLSWANKGWVLVAPCDLPLLSSSHIKALITDLVPDQAAVAEVDGEPQASLAVWPAGWARRVQREVDGGARAFRHALTVGEWNPVELPRNALADADTREELDRLLDSQDGQAGQV